jgi:ankyrin repeat protein
MEAKELIHASLKAGNDVNSRVSNNNSILMELIAASSKLNEKETDRRKSLLNISKVFLKKGIEINAIDDNGETALFRAVRTYDIELISFLLSQGIDINIRNKDYETVLSIIVYQGIEYIDILFLLLRYKADPTIKNENHKTLYEILNELVLHTHNKKIIKDEKVLSKINQSGQYLLVLKELLQTNTQKLDYHDSKGDPLFFEPLLNDHFPMFKLYIKNGLFINNKNKRGHNIFFEYVLKVFENDNENIDFQNNISMLISSKLDQNFQDYDGSTVVHKIMNTSCNINLFDTLTQIVLFDYGITDTLGRTVMHTAIWNAQYQVMKKIHLIDKDCVNIPDIYGILPMTYAAILGNQELVLLLIYLNANVKSGIKIPKQALEKFTPMLKNLNSLKTEIYCEDTLSKIDIVIDQVKADFGVYDKEKRI